MAEERRWRNPFQNESDAFRLLVMFLAGAGLVIAAAEIVGTWLGVIIALILIAFGLYAAVRWLRVGLEENEEGAEEEPV
jgi:hypothetical protein